MASPVDLKMLSTEHLALIFKYVGSNLFMAQQAQGFARYPVRNAYAREEGSFKKTLRALLYVPKISDQ